LRETLYAVPAHLRFSGLPDCAGLVRHQHDHIAPNAGAGPTPVNVYLYVVDIFDVSGSDQAFNADVVLVAEWRDPNLAGKWAAIQTMKLEDVWEPRMQPVNQRGTSTLLPQRVEIHPDGLVRYRQRWSGRFTTRMDLKDFPWIGRVFTSRS